MKVSANLQIKGSSFKYTNAPQNPSSRFLNIYIPANLFSPQEYIEFLRLTLILNYSKFFQKFTFNVNQTFMQQVTPMFDLRLESSFVCNCLCVHTVCSSFSSYYFCFLHNRFKLHIQTYANQLPTSVKQFLLRWRLRVNADATSLNCQIAHHLSHLLCKAKASIHSFTCKFSSEAVGISPALSFVSYRAHVFCSALTHTFLCKPSSSLVLIIFSRKSSTA